MPSQGLKGIFTRSSKRNSAQPLREQPVRHRTEADEEEEFPMREPSDSWTHERYREEIETLKTECNDLRLQRDRNSEIAKDRSHDVAKKGRELRQAAEVFQRIQDDIDSAVDTGAIRDALRKAIDSPSEGTNVDDALSELEKAEKKLSTIKDAIGGYVQKIIQRLHE
ncbi:hypothetical protein FSARC_3182 [Fusarium sarcochroum]|uniref:Uncharacterized protein n=1 Tax=Fusarium sarcochroum TaxID=1208366 RepID=A0A8H4XC17_9HYPO|nr:hypothetical protein FSARC_3182 [Fusarium sarcochroum]